MKISLYPSPQLVIPIITKALSLSGSLNYRELENKWRLPARTVDGGTASAKTIYSIMPRGLTSFENYHVLAVCIISPHCRRVTCIVCS